MTTSLLDSLLKDGTLRQAQMKMLTILCHVDKICQENQIDYWLDAGTLLGAVRHQGFIPWDDDLDIAMTRESFDRFLKIAPSEMPEEIFLQTRFSDRGFFNMATPLKIRDKSSKYLEKFETGDEPYVQGIFIDVFVYDKLPENTRLRKIYKLLAKKISRLLNCKYNSVKTGHYYSLYKLLSRLVSTQFLENRLDSIIARANKNTSEFWGRGFNCVGKNLVTESDIFPLQRMPLENYHFNCPNNPETFLIQQYGDYLTLPPEEERVLRHCKELIPDLLFPQN